MVEVPETIEPAQCEVLGIPYGLYEKIINHVQIKKSVGPIWGNFEVFCEENSITQQERSALVDHLTTIRVKKTQELKGLSNE